MAEVSPHQNVHTLPISTHTPKCPSAKEIAQRSGQIDQETCEKADEPPRAGDSRARIHRTWHSIVPLTNHIDISTVAFRRLNTGDETTRLLATNELKSVTKRKSQHPTSTEDLVKYLNAESSVPGFDRDGRDV